MRSLGADGLLGFFHRAAMGEFLKGYSKGVKRQLRELAGKAYEAELRVALHELDGDFVEWKKGSITPFELVERIHKFHNQTAREIWKRYETGSLDIAVADAIHQKILSEAQIGAEVKTALAPLLGFAKAKFETETNDT